MKKYLYILIAIVIAFLWTSLSMTCKELKRYKELYNNEYDNVKAFENENNALKNDIRDFKYTIDALKNSNDSINQKIVQTIKDSGIKESKVERVEYITSYAHRTDTIVAKDTIFQETMAPVDTLVGDEWYHLNLKLEYPSTIITEPSFKSEKYIIASVKKEYVNPPSKWFFIRWFQKKRKYIGIDVIEKNPYIEDSISRFIEIIK